jgi:cell wall-associated NlpC family hydrolase
MGWAIQAGAFSKVENAARLADELDRQGLGATYFRDRDGLHKVRFGDFKDRESARRRAEELLAKGILEAYYLVAPETLPASKLGASGSEVGIRKSLVETAESYIGIPYLWGGTTPEKGFDCSGLTQAVYRINGLSIPRTSQDQHSKGKSISKSKLKGGDLVFFATGKGKGISHVGIYAGNGVFIHSPKSGQTIRRDRLDSTTWTKQYAGASSYL